MLSSIIIVVFVALLLAAQQLGSKKYYRYFSLWVSPLYTGIITFIVVQRALDENPGILLYIMPILAAEVAFIFTLELRKYKIE